MSAQLPQSLIESDGDTRIYWEGIAQGELRIQHCDACTRYVFYPRSICPHCYSDQLSWVVASGKGHIYSYTVVHQAFGSFAEQAPYIVAIVELVEGVRMMTRILGTSRKRVAVGLPVHVTIESIDGGFTLPYFRLTE